MATIEFEDPFERLLSYACISMKVSARVVFVSPQNLPRVGWFSRAKGATLFPSDGSTPLIMLDATLHRGVQGTLDILAHELAHVAAGEAAEHGPMWEAAYQELFEAAGAQPVVCRKICGEPDSWAKHGPHVLPLRTMTQYHLTRLLGRVCTPYQEREVMVLLWPELEPVLPPVPKD